MAKLDIRLLGEFAIFYDGVPLATVNTPRLQCLLAYLLLHRGAPLARQHLAFLHWPDSSETQARSNLRNLLHSLMRALPEGERFIQSDTQTVQWRPDAPFTLDVETLLTALAAARSAADLQHAIELYRGPLLPVCYEDWIAPEREQLEQKLAEVLQRFVRQWEKEGAYRDAITYAQRLIRCDPLREDLYRQLMRLYWLNGDRAGVVRTYNECRAVLVRELEVEPSRESREAYEKYIGKNAPAARFAQASAPTRAADPTAPAETTPAVPRNAASTEKTQTEHHPSPYTMVWRTVFFDQNIWLAVLMDAIQYPSTAIPLALAVMAMLYVPLYEPRLGGGDLARAVLLLSGVTAAGSFVWRYFILYDRTYDQKSQVLLDRQKSTDQYRQQAALEHLRVTLREGFNETGLHDGQYALKGLVDEFRELHHALEHRKETDPLALARMPALVTETYRQGLSVLEDALELAKAVSSPHNQRLEAEIKDLESKIQASRRDGGDEAQVRLWRDKVNSMRQRLEMVGKQRLHLQEFLQQADKCEGSLHQTRIDLALLKAGSSSVSVDAVLETLDKTVEQAKAVQEELRRLGY